MPSKKSRYKQNIFDVASENFGTLDNLIALSNDNGISISDNLNTGTELEVDNTNLGDADIKQEILDNNYTFNNNAEPSIIGWILETGIWGGSDTEWTNDGIWNTI